MLKSFIMFVCFTYIDGVMLTIIFQAGIVKEISDLYLLRSKDLLGNNSDNVSSINLRGRDGWGDRSVNNLLSAIDARTKLSFPR